MKVFRPHPGRSFIYYAVASVLLILAILSLHYLSNIQQTDYSAQELEMIECKKDEWAELLTSHPYYTRPPKSNAEWKETPKNDRPDLAYELDFLKTMDPATGHVPYERLYKAGMELDKILKGRAPIPNTSWEERGPNNIGGRSRLLMPDPNSVNYTKVWAGGVGGGLWYTEDITAATPTWNKVNDFWDNIAVTTMAYSSSNTQIMYVGTGEGWFNYGAQSGTGIWKTTDGGTTWTNLASTNPGAYNSSSHFHYIQKVLVKSSYVFAATRGYYGNTGGIMRSSDGGATWQRVLSVYTGSGSLYDSAADIEMAPNGDLYASFGIKSEGKVFKCLSANNGASGTWTDLSSNIGIGNAQRIELACAPSDANVIYAVAEGGSGSNDIEWFKKTTDGGTTWTSLTIPKLVDDGVTHFTRGQAFFNLKLAVGVFNSNFLFAGGIDLHKSTDGGITWTPVSHYEGDYSQPQVHADQHDMFFRPANYDEMIFTNDGGIYFSPNAGNSSATPTFTSKNTGYNVTQFYSCATKNEFNSHYFLGGAQDNGSLQITAPQIASAVEVSEGDGGFSHIDQNDPILQFTAYTYNYIFRSLNGGITFDLLLANNTGHFINPSEYDSDRKIMYAAANDDKLKRISGLAGSASNTDLSLSFGTSKISALKMSPTNDVLIMGIANGRVYKITNPSTNSPTLTRIDNGSSPITTTGWVSSIDIGADDNHILVTYSNYGVVSVWETTNGGVNWYSKEGDLPDIPIHWALYNPDNRNQVLVATELGIWSTDDFQPGTSNAPDWGPSNTNLAHTRCNMLKYREADKMVVIATYGRGLFTSDIFTTGSVADFVCDQYASCTGSLVVQFTDASIKPNGTWAWDIDNNGITDYTTRNPIHTYTTPGVYTVKLTVNNGATSVTKENVIVVMEEEPTETTGCTLNDNSNNGNSGLVGIFRFALDNIDHSTQYNDGYYHDYTCINATGLEKNTTYDITIRTGTFNAEGARVYIDYNNNGSLEESEMVVEFPANTEGTRTLSFTTPSSGMVTNTGLRLRVLSKVYDIPDNACDIGSYGQAEDYTVYFRCQLLVTQIWGFGDGTIANAVGCASDGDTIRLSSSLYGQTIDVGGSTLTISKDIVILSEASNISVTGNGMNVFQVSAGADVEFSNFKVRGTMMLVSEPSIINQGMLKLNNMTVLPSVFMPGGSMVHNINGGELTVTGNCYLDQ